MKVMGPLPDPESAYALLIGIDNFTDENYKSLPGSRNGISRIYDLLTDPEGVMWRLPEDRVHRLGGTWTEYPQGGTPNLVQEPVTADQARIALRKAVDQPGLHSLLVCISTHGMRYPASEAQPGLHLAMASSVHDIPGTHWHFDEISRELTYASNTVTHILLIVDSCYADGLSMPEGDGMTAEQLSLEVPGVTVLSATKHRKVAWPHWPSSRGEERTAFLGALIDCVEAGAPDSGKVLTAKQIFGHTRQMLAEARKREPRIPEPGIWATGEGEIPLCANKRYQQPAPEDEPQPGDPAASAAERCFTELRSRGTAPSAADAGDRIRDFCGDGGVSVEQVALLAGKLADSTLADLIPHVYQGFCASRAPSDIAKLADELHRAGVQVNTRLMISSLLPRKRPGRIAQAVSLVMATDGCGECAKKANDLQNLIMENPLLSCDALRTWNYDDVDEIT